MGIFSNHYRKKAQREEVRADINHAAAHNEHARAEYYRNAAAHEAQRANHNFVGAAREAQRADHNFAGAAREAQRADHNFVGAAVEAQRADHNFEAAANRSMPAQQCCAPGPGHVDVNMAEARNLPAQSFVGAPVCVAYSSWTTTTCQPVKRHVTFADEIVTTRSCPTMF